MYIYNMRDRVYSLCDVARVVCRHRIRPGFLAATETHRLYAPSVQAAAGTATASCLGTLNLPKIGELVVANHVAD